MAAFSDSDEEETFTKLGTPLEPIEDNEPRKKPVSLQDIQARDTKGRPRFHGAFTGGFSAGYFNTVGSKEGWTPSTFVSSRNKKVESEFTRRPEDFMDDEDFSEHGIAPRKLVTAGEFTSEERRKRRLDEAKASTQDTAIPGAPALVNLIVPERISIGVKLLRKMGWKEGQGLGPRLNRRERKLQKSGKKIYGCSLPPTSSDEEDDIDDTAVLKDVTFAPRDITPIHLSAKDNTHGLGYRGLNPQRALPSTHINLFEPPAITKKGRKGIRGQAFGVGALEDDDEDIYNTDHMSNYDITMAEEDDENFGWTAPRGKGQTTTPVGYVGKMLEGFRLSSTPLIQKKDFPPPQLPRKFKPVHVFRKPEEEENQSTVGPPGSARGKTQFTDAMSRGVALGEQPFVGTVFDLISKEDKLKIEQAKGMVKQEVVDQRQIDIDKERPGQSKSGTQQVQESQSQEPSRSQKQTDVVKESLNQSKSDRTVSQINTQPVQTIQSQEPSRSQPRQEPAFTSVEEQRKNSIPLFQGAGFKPFVKDPGKQERYEKYLALVKQGHKDPYSAVIMPGQTEWETEREREEFGRAAKLYKPLAGMMAMRFTTGKQQDDDQVDVKVEENIDKCDATKAAEIKMFGKLTRDVLEWHPDRVLCKRFNIPDPYPGSSIIGLATVKRDKYSVFNFLSFSGQSETSQRELLPLTDSSERSRSNNTVTETDPEESKNKVDQELNKSKKMKSIFSHLVETEKESQKVTKGFSFSVKSVNKNKPKEFKSIFSHLEDSEDKPKRKLVTIDTEEPQLDQSDSVAIGTSSTKPDSVGEKASSAKKDQKPVVLEEEEKPEMDLFRAIFKNTDSEDSSSSDEEKDGADEAMETNAEKEEVNETAKDVNVMGKDSDVAVTEKEQRLESRENRLGSSTHCLLEPNIAHHPLSPTNLLPGNGEQIPSLLQRLSPQEISDDEYGPALPPSLSLADNNSNTGRPRTDPSTIVELTKTSSSSKHKHHKHKSKKDKKEKHKKSKHKKKHKKKEKKKSERKDKSDTETDTSGKDTDSDDSTDDVPTDRDILKKMKTILPGQRLRAADFT